MTATLNGVLKQKTEQLVEEHVAVELVRSAWDERVYQTEAGWPEPLKVDQRQCRPIGVDEIVMSRYAHGICSIHAFMSRNARCQRVFKVCGHSAAQAAYKSSHLISRRLCSTSQSRPRNALRWSQALWAFAVTVAKGY
jgi:hypothetical protein